MRLFMFLFVSKCFFLYWLSNFPQLRHLSSTLTGTESFPSNLSLCNKTKILLKSTRRHPTIDSDMSSEINDDDGVFIPHNADKCRRLNPNLVSAKADPPRWVKSYLVFPSAAFQAWVKLGNLTPALMTSYSRKTSSMYTLLSRRQSQAWSWV